MAEIIEIKRLPLNDSTNAWDTILDPRTPTAALKENITADWLVIGAGYAGLAAARRLAENNPQQKIAIVDAGVCGENASGRNSGFVIDIPHTVSSDLTQLDGAHRHMRLARAATAHLTSLVEQHSLQCDWSVDGKYQTAVTDRGSKAMLEPFANELAALGETFQWVRGEELAAKLGTRHFKHAVYTPGCVLMNPAALTRGLADTLPDNVSLFENTPVIKISAANGIRVGTPSGEIQAPKMILAANGFSDQFGYKTGGFVNLAVRASLTHPLNAEERQAYGDIMPWGVTPANAFGGVTMRYTNDHRLLIRQDIRLSQKQNMAAQTTQNVVGQHMKILRDRFPALPKLTFANTWVGYICMSRNGAPAFGQVAHNVWLAACQNGIGVTKGTISGLLAADMACDQPNPLIEDMQSLGTPVELPPKPLVELGARWMMRREVWRNRHEA